MVRQEASEALSALSRGMKVFLIYAGEPDHLTRRVLAINVEEQRAQIEEPGVRTWVALKTRDKLVLGE